ncbi:hypothetical protein BaRGS_00035103 [Batillaria attramentaria]|uniref:Uncharacterized protein n=1 Tax=Batillaria attramentaria TaxID=370345 RepID=A0ABD0JFH1_9CAEN
MCRFLQNNIVDKETLSPSAPLARHSVTALRRRLDDILSPVPRPLVLIVGKAAASSHPHDGVRSRAKSKSSAFVKHHPFPGVPCKRRRLPISGFQARLSSLINPPQVAKPD